MLGSIRTSFLLWMEICRSIKTLIMRDQAVHSVDMERSNVHPDRQKGTDLQFLCSEPPHQLHAVDPLVKTTDNGTGIL